MAAPLSSSELLRVERKEEFDNIPKSRFDDIEFIQFIQSLHDAQTQLFEQEPIIQEKALITLNSISNKFGFGKDSLPFLVFERIKDLIFEDDSSLDVIDTSLQLVESLIERSPWTIDIFLKLDFPKMIYRKILSGNTAVPIDKFSFVLNSLLTNNDEAYSILNDEKPTYFDYLIKKAEDDDISKVDAYWVLVSIQSICASQYFQITDESEQLHKIVQISLKYFERNDSDVMSLVYMLFARCLNSYAFLSPQEIEQLARPEIIQRAHTIIEKKDMSNIRSLFNYIDNYICVNDENTMNFIEMGFIPLFYEIFKMCDNEYQIQIEILGILKNASVSPFEATIEIIRSPLVCECIPIILEIGRIPLKRIALYLLRTLVEKVRLFTQNMMIAEQDKDMPNPSDILLSILQKFFMVADELLNCDDDDIIQNCLYILQHLTLEIQTLEPVNAQQIINMFNLELKEQLFNLLRCDVEKFRGLSENVIRSLDSYCENL